MAGRWFSLLVMTRLLGAGVAIALLAAHRVTAYDLLLITLVVLYAGASLGVRRRKRSASLGTRRVAGMGR